MTDDKAMRDADRAMKGKRDAVGQDLPAAPWPQGQAEIRRLRGKLDWQGDLGAMRSDG